MPRANLFLRMLVLLLAATGWLCAVQAQEPKKSSAIKLPDGTIVFYTSNPNDAVPKIDGVVLSAKEYQQLVETAEQLKKLREAAKPIVPSVCRIRGRVDSSTGRPIAKLSVEYSYRTTVPKTAVLLGGQRAALVAAAGADGVIPLLESTSDGLVVLAEQPGTGTVKLELEAAVTARGSKNELGFEMGLPRAAITTLVFSAPDGVKKLTVGTRTPESGVLRLGETKRTTEDVSRFAARADGTGAPLGPTELLELTWESAAAPVATDANLSADAEIAVRVGDAQIETTTRLVLRGPSREWLIDWPRDASVTASRTNALEGGTMATIVKPADNSTVWTVRTPDAGEWQVTGIVRTARRDPKDGKYAGPYAIPIAFVNGLPRQTGIVRVYAPSTIRVSNYRHSAELRRQDSVAGTEAPTAVFKYATAGPKAPTIDFEARPARGFTAVQPHHRLDLTHEGWRLRTELRVAPVRTFVEQIVMELPSGWREPIVRPDDRVDEVLAGVEMAEKRQWTIRLANGVSEPFTLTIESLYAVPETASDATFALPRFPGTTERETQISLSVPDGLTIQATARDASLQTPLQPVGTVKQSAATQLSSTFETPVQNLEVSWQPYRAELAVTTKADVTLTERQMTITQTMQFKANDPIGRAIRFKGPTLPLALQATPALEPAGPGLWSLTPSSEARELALVLSYSLALPARADANPLSVDLPLFWPDATSQSATVRFWGTPAPGARRPGNVQGPWELRPPEPSPDRESLPWLTLAGVGSTKGIPLSFDLMEPLETGGTTIDRALFQNWTSPEGLILLRARYLLKRWSPSGLELEVSGSTVPSIFVNRERVDAIAVGGSEGDGPRVYRIPLPEPRTNRTSLILEVQSTIVARPRSELTFVPPQIRGATLMTPARCQIVFPSDAVPVVLGSTFLPDLDWGWRNGWLAPVAGASSDELERWFLGSANPGENIPLNSASDDAVTGVQYTHGPLRILRIPRVPFVIVCSLLVLVLGAGITRLRPALVGPALVFLGLIAVVSGVLFPQPASQILSAGIPGLLALVLILGISAILKWLARRRIDYLPTFRRDSQLPLSTGTSTGPNVRPSRNGSSPADSGRSAQPSLAPSATG